jgi:hypothetical protein
LGATKINVKTGRFVKVPLRERFWQKVNKNGPLHPTDPKLGRCWIWIGARITDKKSKHPYGLIWNDAHTKRLRVHRVAWQLVKGPIPKGKSILHSCDNPPCLNPDHLRPGTQTENVQDTVSRGHSLIGERNPMRRLSEDQVKDIRAMYPPAKRTGPRPPKEKEIILRLCKKHSISSNHASRIARGGRWSYLDR